MDKRDVSKSIATIREYDDKVYQLTGESLVSREVSLLSYSYETESSSNLIDIIVKILTLVTGALLGINILRYFSRPKDTLIRIQHRPVKNTGGTSDSNTKGERKPKEFLLSAPNIFNQDNSVYSNIFSYSVNIERILREFRKYSEDTIGITKKILNNSKVNIEKLSRIISEPGYKAHGHIGNTERLANPMGPATSSFKDRILFSNNKIFLTDLVHGNTGVVMLSSTEPKVTEDMRRVIQNIGHVESCADRISSGSLDTEGILRNIIIPVQFKSSEKVDHVIGLDIISIDVVAKTTMASIEDAAKDIDRAAKELINLNKEVKSHIEHLSKVEINNVDMPWVRSILNDVREAGKYTTGIIGDLHVIIRGLRIKPYY